MEAAVDITIGKIIIYVVAGLIIGLLGRLLVPGRQHMSLLATVALGVVSAIIGGLIWNALFPGNSGIAWIGSIIVAVVLVWLYSRFAASRRARPRFGGTAGSPRLRGRRPGGRRVA